MSVSTLKAFSIALIVFAAPAWCGREFQLNSNEIAKSDEIIVRLHPGRSLALVAARYAPGAVIRSIPALNIHLLKLPVGIPPGLASKIAADLDVHFVEPNRIRSINLNVANDPSLFQEWALNTVQAAQAWGLIPDQFLTTSTAGVNRLKIAVLDTGADCTHPDFKNGGSYTDSAMGGQLFFGSGQNVVDTVISPAACPWQDDHGHGTHVTGTIVASANNGIGVAGLAYPLQVVMYKILDNTGNGTDFNVATAIMRAADAGVQVISMSIGGDGYSQTLQAAIDYAWQRNVLVVAAAGNGATNTLTFPAGASHAIGVAATDSANATAGFSNHGDYVEIAAPGVSIYSTMTTYATPLGGNSYGYLSGTSMATPHVAALGGLLALTTPGIAAASIAQRIEQTATSSVPAGGWDMHVGYGIINAYNAINGTNRTATLGALRGQVTDASGLPLTSGAPNYTPVSVPVTFNSQTVMTDPPSGLFRFPSVPPGTYAFSVSAPGYPSQNLTATIAPGADTIFPVQMAVTYGQFTGTVLDQGVPVPYSIVQALSGSLIQATTTTDAFGQYTLWVAAGNYTLRASAVARTGTNATGTVAGGGASTVNLQISRFGRITGHVTNGSGQPIGSAQVAIAVGASNIAGATTDGSGMYTTIGVPGGTYSVTATIPGPQSATAAGVAVVSDVDTTANITIGSAPPATTATFVRTDTTTQGNWRSGYGADGYNVIGDLASNPSYASPSASGQATYTWASSTSDIRALQKPSNGADRTAGTWYSGSSFIIDSNITDTAPHQVALYLLDWDTTARRETVDVLDTNGTVLNTQVVNSSFNGGVYLVWNVTGHVKFRLTWNAGFNAVVSGLFFGGPSGAPPPTGTAAFVKTDTTTQGNWRSAYGADGYNVIGDLASNPSYAAPAGSGQALYTWAASSSDVRALQKASNSADRIAATWYASNSFLVDTNITDQALHQVALYCLDWDGTGRRETIDVLDSSGTVLNTQSLTTSFNGGVYLVWNVTGHVKFRVTLTGGTNAVLSGLFFGGPAGAPPPPTATATFVKTDTATQGNWRSVYGADGYNIIGDLASNPSYAAPAASGQASYTWAGSTADIRALQKASNSTDRIAATWYSGTSLVIDSNITDAAPHQVALYCLDWDTSNRQQTIDVLDANGTLLNTQALTTSFNGGVYVVWNVTGHVKFRVTWKAGYNAVVSGLFFR